MRRANADWRPAVTRAPAIQAFRPHASCASDGSVLSPPVPFVQRSVWRFFMPAVVCLPSPVCLARGVSPWLPPASSSSSGRAERRPPAPVATAATGTAATTSAAAPESVNAGCCRRRPGSICAAEGIGRLELHRQHSRQTLKVPDHSLNYAVLRGLDRAVGPRLSELGRCCWR